MAEPLERNSLELRMAFHNAVSRFQDWTANVAEPKVRLHGRFRPISEVCEEVANLSNLLPEFIRSILYKETTQRSVLHQGAGAARVWGLVALFESVSGPFCCGGFEPSGLGEQFYTDVLKY